MAKKLIIDKCGSCTFFDNEYYGYEEECILLDRKIKREGVGEPYLPPNDCPLPEVDEPVTEG